MKAIFNDVVIAESNETVVVENNHYFPPQSLKREYFLASDRKSTCPWKGLASYYSVNVAGKTGEDVAWYYPSPSAAAHEIKDHVAFWKGVRVEE
jgi:uncharacterized protein (DUF427 family)